MTVEWRRGSATTNSAKLLVRSSVSGTLSAVVNGITYTGDAVTTGEDNNDGWGVIEITDLTTAKVPVTLKVDGVEVVPLDWYGKVLTPTIHAMPSLPVIGWGTCNDNSLTYDLPGTTFIAKQKPDVFFHLGDWIYCETINNGWGLTKPATDGNGEAGDSLTNATSKANYYTMHRIQGNNPSMRPFTQGCAFYYTGDDHERPGGDWDSSIRQANDTSDTTWATTLANVADAEAAAFEVLAALTQAQPSESAGVQYFTQVISPHIQAWVLDGIHYCTPRNNADYTPAASGDDDAQKTRLGATQLAWFKASLAASTAAFKLVFSSKSISSDWTIDPTTNKDNWANYDVEAADLRAAISVETGLVWLTGDKHTGQAWNNPTLDAVTYTYPEVQAGTIGKGTHDCTDSLLNVSGLIYKQLPDTEALSPPALYGYQIGRIEFAPDASYMEITIHSRHNRVPFRGRVYAGEKGFRLGYKKSTAMVM